MELKSPILLGMPRNLAILALAQFTWGLGEGMFMYFQPLSLQSFGARPFEVGAILSIVGVAMAFSQVPAGAISDRIGARPVLRAAWVIGLLATVLMALAGSLSLFVAGMVLYGVTSFVSAPINSYEVLARGNWSVERALTVAGAIYHLGTFFGALSGGWVGEQWGLQNIYRVSTVILLGSTVIVFQASRLKAADDPEPQAALRPRLVTNPRFLGLLAVVCFSLFALYLPQPLTSIYLSDQHNFSFQAIGQIAAVGSLSNAFLMLTLGSLLRANIGLIAGQLLVGLFVLLIWQGSRPWMFYLGYSFLGGYRLYRSMAMAQVRTAVRESQIGLAFGLIETGNAVAVILAPLAAGFLYDRDPQSVYLVSMVAIGLGLAFHFLLIARGRPRLGADQEVATTLPNPADLDRPEDRHGY